MAKNVSFKKIAEQKLLLLGKIYHIDSSAFSIFIRVRRAAARRGKICYAKIASFHQTPVSFVHTGRGVGFRYVFNRVRLRADIVVDILVPLGPTVSLIGAGKDKLKLYKIVFIPFFENLERGEGVKSHRSAAAEYVNSADYKLFYLVIKKCGQTKHILGGNTSVSCKATNHFFALSVVIAILYTKTAANGIGNFIFFKAEVQA